MSTLSNRLFDLEKIWKITSTLHSSRNVQETLDSALSPVMSLIDAESGTLWLLDETGEYLYPFMARGPRVDYMKDLRLRIGEGIAGWVTQNRESQIIEDVTKDERWAKRFDQSTGYVTHSMICVPLATADTTLGCLQMINKRSGQLFNQDDLKLAEELAGLVAIALHRQRLLIKAGTKKTVLNRLDHITKNYVMGEVVVEALKDTSLEVYEGEILVILGPSGSGKSTMLNLLGGMDKPSSGGMYFRDRDLTHATEKELTMYRRYDVGFVFQFYNLIPDLTASENVALAAELVDEPLTVEAVLEEVGLSHRYDHFPAQLSGGEQQRVSIARAIVKRPSILLCDEPTGALDDATGKLILKLLEKIAREHGTTVAIVTHNASIAAMADRVFKMRSGNLVEVVINPNPIPAERIEW